MASQINFRDGLITHENLFWMFEHSDVLMDELDLTEDLLQVSFFNEEYILDVGWYRYSGNKGKFRVYIIKKHDWQHPLFIRSEKKINALISAIEEGINCIYRDKKDYAAI